MKVRNRSIAACGLALLLTSICALGAESTKRESYESHYGPIVEHNIFAKDRPIIKKPTTQAAAAVPRTAEESLVLRGVALDADGSIRAYVEDVDNEKVLCLGLGDLVGRGKVVAIDYDAVEYERNGEPIWIETGADFTGKQVIAITSDVAPSAAGLTATTGPAEVINPNDPNLTLEQKMKLRRLHPELYK